MKKDTLKTIIDIYEHSFKTKLHIIKSEYNNHYVCWAFEKKHKFSKNIPMLSLGGGIYDKKLKQSNFIVPMAKYSLYKSYTQYYKQNIFQSLKKTKKKYIKKLLR
tara:strand:- start:275 stop:589 length:315 start_codon:yes stop_codon:yes gene_type:complete